MSKSFIKQICEIENLFLSCFIFLIIAPFPLVIYNFCIPSLPAIKDYLQPTWGIELIVGSYVLGSGISYLPYGLLSEKISSKKILVLGMLICLAGTVFCVLAKSIEVFILGRLLQGFGAAACYVLFKVIIMKLFHGQNLTAILSIGSIFLPICPWIAQVMGGYVQSLFSWQTSFLIIIIYIISVVLITLVIIKDDKSELTNKKDITDKMFSYCLSLLKEKRFIIFALLPGLHMAGMAIYFSVSPFLFRQKFTISSKMYGCLYAFIVMASIFGKIFNTFLIRYLPQKKIILNGIIFIIISGVILIVSDLYFSSIFLFIIAMMFYALAGELICTNSMLQALKTVPKNKLATANFIQASLFMITAFLLNNAAIFLKESQIKFSIALIVLGILGLLLFNSDNTDG
jgi:MFS family permease